jgi:pantetheine-phosphate adenylyltransferase
MHNTLAVYAGSFDPPTYGHLDLVERASKLFGQVIVAVGVHPSKSSLLSSVERIELLTEVTAHLPNVRIDGFNGLLYQYCEKVGARVIVRGLRAATDFEYELQIAHANRDMAPAIDTVFLPTRLPFTFLSSSLVREIAGHGGDVRAYAPEPVCAALTRHYRRSLLPPVG